MEERTIRLSLEKAREYYNKGGELRGIALQAFGKGEILEYKLPNTWEEFLDIIYEYDAEMYKDAKSECMSETCRAYSRLRYLRECYRQGWVPDWFDYEQRKFCIIENDGLEVEECYQNRQFLAFQSQELAEQFLDNFRDIIIKADIL